MSGPPPEQDRCFRCGVRKAMLRGLETPCESPNTFSHTFTDPCWAKPLLWGKHCRGIGCDDFNEQAPSCSCKCSACTRPRTGDAQPLSGTASAPPIVDRAWLNETWLELRASLEGALMLFDRLGRLEHNDECDHYNACQNAECECPEDDDGCVTHTTTSCTCLVFDAAAKARDVRVILDRTTPPAWRRRESPQSGNDEKGKAK